MSSESPEISVQSNCDLPEQFLSNCVHLDCESDVKTIESVPQPSLQHVELELSVKRDDSTEVKHSCVTSPENGFIDQNHLLEIEIHEFQNEPMSGEAERQDKPNEYNNKLPLNSVSQEEITQAPLIDNNEPGCLGHQKPADLPLTKSTFCLHEEPTVKETKESNNNVATLHNGSDSEHLEINSTSFLIEITTQDKHNKVSNHSETQDNLPQPVLPDKNTEFDSSGSESPKNITASTLSLAAAPTPSNLPSKHLSKSIENIPTNVATENEDNIVIAPSISHDNLLQPSNATSQPSTIVPEQQSMDSRYSRIQKDIPSQDQWNIVKNVHGIFSSVSGSLKNAYSISHKVVPKPQLLPKITKPSIINEIFDDAQPDPAPKADEIENTETAVAEKDKIDIPKATDGTETSLDVKSNIFMFQVETLERVLAEQRREMSALRERVKQQTDELAERDQTFKDLEGKMDLMRKSVERAERERAAAVVRYATGERAAMAARAAADAAAAAARAAAAERDLTAGKLQTARAERLRLANMYDEKCHELSEAERDAGRAREELREMEGRLKWTQSKLRVEMDAYKEASEKAEAQAARVSQLEAAAGAADAARARTLESELQESQAALILSRHEATELQRRVSSLSHQLDACTRERDDASGDVRRLTEEMEGLRENNAALEAEAAALASLRARAALADTLASELDAERAAHADTERALHAARARADTCAAREAAALRHARDAAQRLAERAPPDHSEALALGADVASLRAELAARAGEAARARAQQLVLARKVAELTAELEARAAELDWERGESALLRKKHANAVKELNRELQRALRRCEQLETRRDDGSGSVTSLSSAEGAAAAGAESAGAGAESAGGGAVAAELPDIQPAAPDRQALIERVVSLQRAAARRADRADFLEEHARQLTAELSKKTRVLRQLLCASGEALPPADRHKQEIARLGGGAMAAVWGGDPAGMSLQVSLDMNRRLQAVLEDALWRNICLKENIDTLGAEIERLKAELAQKADK